MSEQMTKAALLDRMADAYEMLERTVAGLDEAVMARPGDEGWAIKDHLFHLATWERGIAWLLSGRSRTEGMGITEEAWRDLTMDEVNDLVARRDAAKTPAEALVAFRLAHREMLDALAGFGDADLERPYRDFDPAATRSADRPIAGWIIGDTYEHYEEHLGYIQRLLTT